MPVAATAPDSFDQQEHSDQDEVHFFQMKITHLSWSQLNMSSIGEGCDSLGTDWLSSFADNSWATGGLRVNSTSGEGGLISFPLLLLEGNAIFTMTPKAGIFNSVNIWSNTIEASPGSPLLLSTQNWQTNLPTAAPVVTAGWKWDKQPDLGNLSPNLLVMILIWGNCKTVTFPEFCNFFASLIHALFGKKYLVPWKCNSRICWGFFKVWCKIIWACVYFCSEHTLICCKKEQKNDCDYGLLVVRLYEKI